MGSWSTTCGISNLPIGYHEEVVVFLLVQDPKPEDFIDVNAYFTPCFLPFYGKYNDYGCVEDCHGPALPLLLERLRERLTELPQGGNKYHDIPAVRSELTIKKLFELDREDRLFIDGNPKNWGKKVTHMPVKKSILDYLKKNWLQYEVGSDKGFKFEAVHRDFNKLDIEKLEMGIQYARTQPGYRNKAIRCLYEGDMTGPTLITFQYSLSMLGDDPKAMLREALVGGFLNRFMQATRRPWIRTIATSHTDAEPYHCLMAGITKVLAKEKKDRDDF